MTILFAPGDGRHRAGARIEPQILAIQGEQRHAVLLNGSSRTSPGPVNAVIERPFQAVGQALNVRDAEAFQDVFALISDAVAVGVFQIPQGRGGDDKDATVKAADRLWPGQLVGKDRAAVHLAIAVGIFQQADGAKAFRLPFDVLFRPLFGEERVVAHLDDIHTSVFIERSVDRVDDIRFGCDQFQRETALQFERGVGVGGFVGGDAWQLVCEGGGGLCCGQRGGRHDQHTAEACGGQKLKLHQVT